MTEKITFKDSEEAIDAYFNEFIEFPTRESCKEFFTTICKNHPNGIDIEYFASLFKNYLADLTIQTMVQNGLIKEVWSEEKGLCYKSLAED